VTRDLRNIMGYTTTDTVSCRLLPSQIAQLRELAAAEEVSLSRFVSGLCLTAIQGREKVQASTRNDELGAHPVAILDTEFQCGASPSRGRKESPIADIP
jgi:hypothetical protein